MERNKACFWGFLSLALLLAGCGSYQDTGFIHTEKYGGDFEYMANVVVNREGLHFLWIIPFASASEERVKEVMEEKVRERYPDAVGVYEFREMNRRGVGLFDWRPVSTYMGTIVRPSALEASR